MSSIQEDKETIIKVLIREFCEDRTDALNYIKEMKKRVREGENPEEILYEIGLEPDYIFALL